MAHHVVGAGLSPETLAKVKALHDGPTRSESPAIPYTPTEMLLAEYADYYGYEALRDALEGRITAATFQGLLAAGRTRATLRRAETMRDMYTAIACAMSKNGNQKLETEIKRMTRNLH